MRHVLVTGASGQLGITLQEMAVNCEELGFDFKTSKELDISKREQVNSLFTKEEFDFCINCAAFTNVEEAENHPKKAFKVNAQGVKNLAEACREHRTILIHISTDYVFDGEKEGPYYPDDKPNPINVYGESKLLGEGYIKEIMNEYHIVRTSWLYNKNHGKNFYRTILQKASKGETIRVTDQQKGNPTSTVSLSEYLLEELILGETPFGVHHFTDDQTMTWYDFAKKILNENGYADKVQLVADSNYRTFAKRPLASILGKT